MLTIEYLWILVQIKYIFSANTKDLFSHVLKISASLLVLMCTREIAGLNSAFGFLIKKN